MSGKNESDAPNVRKPFDKRKWREQKYSHKRKLDEWQERRKKAIVAKYKEDLANDHRAKFDVQKIYQQYAGDDDDDATEPKPPKKDKVWEKPHEKYQRLQREKSEKIEEARQRRQRREQEKKEAKRKRCEKNRIFTAKTNKGQPLMKKRMEYLLQEIEKSMQT